MKNPRTRHNPAFKAKVALSTIREDQSIPQLAKRYGLHPNQLYKWKKQLLEQAAVVFDRESSAGGGDTDREDELLKKIGELTVERDFLSRGLERRR